VRCGNFNDGETTIAAITRAQFINNICSNNTQGIYLPANNASNFTNLALARNDFNDDYNNTTNPTNLTQTSFLKSSAEYNTGTRNVTGVYLFNPQGYTLPDSTSRSLVQTVSGTWGSTGNLTLAWSGGTAVSMVYDQGALTSAPSTGQTCGTLTTCTTLTISSKSWPTSNTALEGYLGSIVAGTGAGEYFMVYSNTATVLTVFANTTSGAFGTTPASGDTIVLWNPQQKLYDSGGTNYVYAGLHPPTLTLSSQTDSGITMTVNALAVNPNYRGPDGTMGGGSMQPTNPALKGVASDGGDIGALSVYNYVVKHRISN